MTGNPVFDTLLLGVFAAALITILVLLFVNAPYGRHQKGGWGPGIPVRIGWVLMESPASILFLIFYLTGDNRAALPCLILLFMWQLHYVHRAFIYPFQIKVKEGAKTPLLVFVMGSTYCAINGYLNGSYITHYAPYLNNDWLTDPRFILGIALFAYGYYLNKQSDSILRNLRKEGETGYKVPHGGGFRWVTMPNYLGEILTWSGFALASWSLAGVSFVVFTMANLVPRALANHKWYRETFTDYPSARKAIFPKLL
ncbi:Putative steroid dehydrogenase [gamma proteobacterium HdN1]|nr:Putative steroid dehydrogenase [gamma proteobacterium HdN1]